jgi:3-deoxy-7-phosphoheptulonate synthase
MLQLQLRPCTPAERDAAIARLRGWADRHGARLLGAEATGEVAGGLLYIDGAPHAAATELAAWPNFVAVTLSSAPARGPAAESAFTLGPARFGGRAFSVIAGPCAVEDAAALLDLARVLPGAGASALRGGAFKPRTSPHAFQGLGAAGLEALAAARAATGLPVVTELLDPRDLTLLAAHADMIQIGSRNMHNGALLREAGRAGKPVLLKRGMAATLDEFLYAAEYVASGGCTRIVLCERGLRHFDPAVRNLLDLSAVPALQQRTRLPVIVDPSHGTGHAALVPAMMAAAAAAGADGLLVEVHQRPAAALCDGEQALEPAAFAVAMRTVEAVLGAVGRTLSRIPAAAAASR